MPENPTDNTPHPLDTGRVSATDRVAATDRGAIHAFLTACSDQLVESATTWPAREGAARFAAALERCVPTPCTPCWLPVLDTIGTVEPSHLARHFVDIAPLLIWEPTFRTDDRGTTIALAPLDRVVDLSGLTVGIMYVAPHHQYPVHAHPPNELYLTIAGEGQWRFGGHDELRHVAPGTTLYNHPGDLHSAAAGATPLVALYVLWE